jgi:tetratricopeptide (TPR) repeat protein
VSVVRNVSVTCGLIVLIAVSIVSAEGTRLTSGADQPQKWAELEELQRDAQKLIEQAYEEANLGRHREAEDHYSQALELFRRRFPKLEYPRGHPAVASCLFDLGNVVLRQGKFAQAQEHYRSALALWRLLYPESERPSGHLEIASTLNNLGVALMRQGKLEDAAECHRQALAMRRRLYPKDRFPLGHIQIAKSLLELGATLGLQGKDVVANGCRKQAMEMLSRLQSGKGPPKGERGARKITFNSEDYFISSSETVPGANAALDEYLLEGEDIDTYSKLISVAIFHRPMDLREFAASLGTELGKADSDLRTRVMVRPDGSEALVDYVFRAKDPEPLLEYFGCRNFVEGGQDV